MARNDLILRLGRAINSVIKAEVKPYGSYASELASYYSDIDVSVHMDETPSMNTMLRINQVISTQVGRSQYISNAKIPIIRGTCRTTLIDFDISFNSVGDTFNDVRTALSCSPIEKCLILTLKAFLR